MFTIHSVQEHPDREVLHTLRLGMYCNANHMAKIADNC